jgi:hypothetical protein
MTKAERQKQAAGDSHRLEEHNPLLMKSADNAVNGNGMNWKNVGCEVEAHGTSVAVGHSLHLARTTKAVADELEVAAYNRCRSCRYIDRLKT